MMQNTIKNCCRICEGLAGKRFEAQELVYGTSKPFEYFMCTDCGCLQITEIPENIADFYPQDFYSYSKKTRKTNHPIKTWARKVRAIYALEKKGLIGSIIHSLKKPSDILEMAGDIGMKVSDSILDVGGGTGDFAWQLRTFGFEDVLAVDKFIDRDVFVDGSLLAKKAEIFSIDKEYDFITFHHSLEHMDQQSSPLLHAKKILKPNGKILVRIPTVTSDAWEEYGVKWVGLDAPRHFYIHSHQSIRLLAEQVGLKVSRLWSDSTIIQFWVSEQNVQGISMNDDISFGRNPEKSIFRKDQIELFDQRVKDINERNRGDTICVLLEQDNDE